MTKARNMTAPFFQFPCGACKSLSLALAVFGVAVAFPALAQSSGQGKPTTPEVSTTPPAPNPLRAVTDFLNWTTEAGDGPDFVRESHPDPDKLNYSNLTGVDKKRAPVKKPEEVKAAQDRLIAERKKAEAKAKALQSEKLDPPAPNKVEPIKDE